MLFGTANLVLGLLWTRSASAALDPRHRFNGSPKYHHDKDTTKFCVSWLDNTGDWTCGRIKNELDVSLSDFHGWNPSVSADCKTLPRQQSFCISTGDRPAPLPGWPSMQTVTVSATRISTTTLATTATVNRTLTAISTATLNRTLTSTAISTLNRTLTTTALSTVNRTLTATATATLNRTLTATSTATLNRTLTATSTATLNRTLTATSTATLNRTLTATSTATLNRTLTTISTATFNRTLTTTAATATLNRTITVSILTTSTSTATRTTTLPPVISTVTATPTAARNGIATPLPPQPNMVTNCQAFYYVRRGETCNSIAAKLRGSVSAQQIIAWNPNARSDCTLLFADYFACVGLL
ncbi:hypothetical protein B0H63DRAFT_558344 [Podospora didyma]|uniref:LysM domain-containing protein n=1 Tax=Podospora didyma TaxID=330526 RepID=A0AAE0U0S9_9PEZI|nr:hypothetical protein B0H63DRAFT_558344 [Podospora didyma]